MKTVVIACKTIEDELNHAMRRVGCDYPVLWLEQGLHNVPQRLMEAVRDALEGSGADRALLAMGFCGNALLGMKTPVAEMIFPRVDDCISLLLGSVQRRLEISGEYAAYFFTEGWLRGERNIWVEHQYMLETYGEEITAELEESMYGHYRTLGLLDCGIKPMDALMEGTRMIAEGLHLRQQIIPASVAYLEQLLTGPWPEDRFVCLRGGEEITSETLTLAR